MPAPPVAPVPPALTWMAEVRCEVGERLTLGATPLAERRHVPLLGGSVSGPELEGSIVPGGSDWQWQRHDGAIELDAHYLVATPDGAHVEIRSQGLRHGPPEVLARLARGEAVPPDAYFFRTQVRFVAGPGRWEGLNRVLAIASGRREARRVVLDLWRLG